MSIKSDKWIRRMAAEHGMIEPFEPGQVREVEGRKIISYGTSSYGYDIRCAPEFKVFTNIHSTVVDPEELRRKSFLSISKATAASSRPTALRWRARSNTSASRATCSPSAWAKHLRALRHHRQRDPVRARVGRVCDAGVQQHHAVARTHLCRRRLCQVLFFESDKDDVCEVSYRDRGRYQARWA